GKPAKKELYELRRYRLGDDDQRKRLDAFLGEAAIPAMNRIGIRPVGAFGMMTGEGKDLIVLLPHPSAESVVTATGRLLADAKFLKDGGKFLKAPKSAPLYQRVESSLLLAFDAVPKLETAEKADTRVFQLRTYESHSVERGQKKIEMFNTGGEVAIFRRAGMNPVFFGEAIVGTKLPNLTYMLVFKDMPASKEAWGKFMRDPAWRKLSRDPAYKDTVSRITNTFLRPAAYSQI
ncbi:MAG: NIPSNAP family containing protein, partial [Planctomycetes bacterium SM23_25]